MANRIKVFSRWCRKFLHIDLWGLDFSTLSRIQRVLVKDTRVVLDTIEHLNEHNLGMLSASLCYFCTMAVVPLLALCMFLCSGIGMENLIREIMVSNFDSEPMVELVLGAADNIVVATRSGLFGVISIFTFLWMVIWMMDRVEKVFNIPWGVSQPKKVRKFWWSYSVDLAILLLVPFVIVLFLSGNIVYSRVLDYILPGKAAFSETLRSFLGWVVFGVIAILIISAMYKFIPTAKVDYSHALHAATIAGVAFTILQYIYLETQVLFNNINAVYGTIAALPLFLLWLRFGWMIVVFGVQVSYSFQHQAQMLEAMKGAKRKELHSAHTDGNPENDNLEEILQI